NAISGKSTIDGAIGALISGDHTKTSIAGDIAVTGGGTGMVIDGDDTLVDNKGTTTVSGEGSTGSIINGNNTHATNEGAVTVSDGGTGAKVNGDGATVDNVGDTTASGAGSTGLYINGDKAVVTSEGDLNIDSGAIGAIVDGNNATVINTGKTNVDGTGSIGTLINGDNATSTQNGDMLVTNGANGIQTNGKNSRITNKGNTTVRDADSVGFLISGNQNIYDNEGDVDVSLNGTGALISGDNTQVTLAGNINVHAEKDSEDTYRGATGINVTGNNTTTEISGNVRVSSAYDSDDMATAEDKLTGVTVSGTGNDIVLDGKIDIFMNDQTSQSGQYLDSFGLNIQGDGNTAKITGGINIDYTLDPINLEDSTATGIHINGASTVTLSGKSTVNSEAVMGSSVMLANVENRGMLILDEDSEVDINFENVSPKKYNYFAILRASGEGSTIENRGSVVLNGATPLFLAENGAHIINSGKVTANESQQGSTSAAVMEASQAGSLVENSAGGNIKVTSTLAPFYNAGIPTLPLRWYGDTNYAMLAYNGATAINDEGATITLQGAGVYGVSASKGSAINAGNIDLDGFKPTLDANGNITSTSYWHPSELYFTSSGMIAGSTDSGKGDATAINTGTITVNNAGFGMMALNGGSVINQGTITLNADAGVTGTDENQLVGMVALNGGKVVNDETGIININANYGKPFYIDSSSSMVNYGTVCIGGDCQSAPAGGGSSSSVNSTGSYTLSGYVVGTSANGSAGQLTVNNASLNGVGINTGFTAGTADTTVTFDNVVEGDNLTNADAIQSTSVVWNAQGTTDASGNVDVTMTKNAYTDVVTDSSVSDVAQALDAGYTNNELYTSLNVSTTAELNSALKQVSGSQATTVFREARV
ncbi:beta strand repeat-containing protein, partial [Huaxiibacter chinensis]|uniref:beta strand repeat-containing protein n=1 Tax=Huaxiibacter chinensis TaxID=2899785 RepID=UPI003D31E01A